MIAMKCDRCGEYYAPYGPQKDNFNSNTVGFVMRLPAGQVTPNVLFDLCPDCMMDVVNFVAPYGSHRAEPEPAPAAPINPTVNDIPQESAEEPSEEE